MLINDIHHCSIILFMFFSELLNTIMEEVSKWQEKETFANNGTNAHQQKRNRKTPYKPHKSSLSTKALKGTYTAISSWPKRGGKETSMSRNTGTSHDPGYSATFCAYGARKFTICCKLSLPDASAYLIMQDKCDNCHNKENDAQT